MIQLGGCIDEKTVRLLVFSTLDETASKTEALLLKSN
jgi:hypothetical protein